MILWKWFLLFSTVAIFAQILLAGLMFMGFTFFHTTWGHLIFIPILITLILAWRQKAGQLATRLIGVILVVDLIQAEPLAHNARLAGLVLTTNNLALLAHGINALILYTLSLSVTVWAVRRPEVKQTSSIQS